SGRVSAGCMSPACAPGRDVMTHQSAGPSCFCAACGPASVSRRQFLCTAAVGAVAAPMLAAGARGAAVARHRTAARAGPAAAGRRILIKGGCVLTLDRAAGDFDQADVLIEGTRIAAVQPSIAVQDAEVIDAANMIVMPGFVDTHRHMWQGVLRNSLPD